MIIKNRSVRSFFAGCMLLVSIGAVAQQQTVDPQGGNQKLRTTVREVGARGQGVLPGRDDQKKIVVDQGGIGSGGLVEKPQVKAAEVNARYSDPSMLPSPDGYVKPRTTRLKMPEFRDPKEQAFDELLDDSVSISREEISRYYDRLDEFKRAVRNPDNLVRKSVISAVVINLQPGSIIPAMRLNVNENSSILFTDSTGNPWPIIKYAAPSKSMFSVEFHANNNPHEIAIEPIKDYAYGNLKVFLAGLSTPVFVRLVTGQRETDVRLDARLPLRGPNAAAVVEKQLPPEASSSMFSMLNGVAPEKALELKVDGADARAWMLSGKMYLRLTNWTTVRSPSWTGTMSSIDGTNVYELPARTPVIYAAQEGKSIELKVSGF